ncbi:MAG: hypothetical protein MJK13_15860, partial [Pseudomonadales bacterium]|nr:hypothetical protein [Pseudomonadales bacterium]
MHKSKKVILRNFLFSMLAYHIALLMGYISVWFGISHYSATPFNYLLLLMYLSNLSIIFFWLRPSEVSREYSDKMQAILVVNWLLLFAFWCFFRV